MAPVARLLSIDKFGNFSQGMLEDWCAKLYVILHPIVINMIFLRAARPQPRLLVFHLDAFKEIFCCLTSQAHNKGK